MVWNLKRTKAVKPQGQCGRKAPRTRRERWWWLPGAHKTSHQEASLSPALKKPPGIWAGMETRGKKIKTSTQGRQRSSSICSKATEQAAANCSNSLETTQRKKGVGSGAFHHQVPWSLRAGWDTAWALWARGWRPRETKQEGLAHGLWSEKPLAWRVVIQGQEVAESRDGDSLGRGWWRTGSHNH